MGRKLTSWIFQVKGMSCASCEIKIENRLRKIEGIIEVKVSLAQSEISVKFDSTMVTNDLIETTITKLGYCSMV